MECSRHRESPTNSFFNNGDFLLILIGSLLFMVLVTLFTGCKQIEYVPVVENHTDTMYISKVQRDSIYLHDSTYIHEKGDTIFFEKWHTKFVEKFVHDTTYVATHDTIPQPYEVEKIVKEKYTPKLVKILAWVGGIALAILIILAGIKIKKFF